MTTKILALTDALGNMVRFVLLPGQRFDTVGVAPLIKDIEFGGLIAPGNGLQANHCRATDKAFDSNTIIEELTERGAKIVISQHPRRTAPIKLDADIYKWRHLIENFFSQTQRVQTYRHESRQDKPQLCRHDLPVLSRHQLQMNFNSP